MSQQSTKCSAVRVPVKVITTTDTKIPESPIIAFGESSNYESFLPGLKKSESDIFNDSLRLCSPLPPSPFVAEEIYTYMKYMANLFEQSIPQIDECLLRLKLASLHPTTNPQVLVNRAIKQNYVNRQFGDHGQPIIAIK